MVANCANGTLTETLLNSIKTYAQRLSVEKVLDCKGRLEPSVPRVKCIGCKTMVPDNEPACPSCGLVFGKKD